jgi:hypothetical protein
MSGTCTATSFYGSGANLTNLPLSSYSTTGNDASYLLKTGGTLTGTLNGPTINATTNFNVNSVNINNWLFNSGFGHETLTNFNNITDYGYRFINTPGTNGPGTPTVHNQYYSWFIGLGTEYAYNSYGAQVALPRKRLILFYL